MPGPQWETLLSTIVRLRGAVMLIGATDSGKTTLARYLITQLLSKDMKVSLVDSDLGQTSLGLPGTISTKVFTPEEATESFSADRMFFVGAVNPAKRIPLVIRTTGRAVESCRKESDVVVIDTSGLVSGNTGKVLKAGKIKAVSPELIVAVQRADELEHILKPAGAAAISRLTASEMVKSRDTAARVRYREKKYENYFDTDSTEYLLRVEEAELFYNGRTLGPKAAAFPRGNVIGLNHGEETLALGLLTEIADDWITFRSPLKSLKRVNRIVFGDITFGLQGHSA